MKQNIALITFGELTTMLKNASLFTDPNHEGLDIIKITIDENGVSAFSTNKKYVTRQTFGSSAYDADFTFAISRLEAKALMEIGKSMKINPSENVTVDQLDGKAQFRYYDSVIIQIQVTEISPVLDNALSTFLGNPRETITHPHIILNRENIKMLGKLTYPDKLSCNFKITTFGNHDPIRVPIIVLDIGDWMEITLAGVRAGG